MARTAGRADELRIVAQYVGASYGQTTKQVDDQIASIQQSGIRYDMAARAVVDMTEAQLDMSKSTDLVKIAQASAIKSGQDSSATLQQIIYGIRTLQPEMLRTAGITVSLDEAMAMYTDKAGNHIKAVTGQEKQQALFNAVLQKGSGLLGLYDVAMQEPEKRLRSLDRVTYEISRTVGANFKPSFGDAVSTLEYFTKSVLKAVSDGGVLHDFLLNFGATAGVFSEQVLGMAKSATDFGVSFTSDMGTSLSGAAESALSWGINIVTQLADGIIQGAAGALTAAMDFIGSILSSFLSPGSPPKVAPDIDAWGAETMDEYLQGFSEADYGILESVQGPLQSVLDMLGRSGDFGALNAELAQGLAAVGDGAAVSASFLSKLSAIGGVYGQEIANLITRQTDLAAATKGVTDADAAYAEQQKIVEQLAAGAETQAVAGPDALLGGYEKDRFKVRAMGQGAVGGTEALAAAKAKLEALDQDRKAAKEREAQAKSLLNLQEKLVKQLIAQAQWQDKLAKQVEAAQKTATKATEKKPVVPKKGAGAGAGALGGLAGGMGIPKIGALINEELDKAKAAISEKLGTLFAPLAEKWKTSMAPAIAEVQKSFGRILDILFGNETTKTTGRDKNGELIQATVRTNLGLFGQLAEAIKPVTDAIAKLFPPDILTTIGEFIGIAAVAGGGILGVQFAFGLAATAVGIMSTALLAFAANPVVLVAAALAMLTLGLEKYGEKTLGADAATATFGEKIKAGFTGILTDAWNSIMMLGPIIRYGLEQAGNTVWMMGQIIQYRFWEFMNNCYLAVVNALNSIWNFITNTLNSAWVTVQMIGAIIAYEFWNFLNNAWVSATERLEVIRATIEEKITAAQAKWKEITDKIAEEWKTLWEGIKTKFDELWVGVQTSLTAAKNFFYNTFFKPISDWVYEMGQGLAGLIGLFEDLRDLANKVGAKVASALAPKPAAGSKQGGGPVTAGLWRLHDQEFVLSRQMRRGQQAIPPSALSLTALSRLVSTPARNGMAAVPAMAMGGSGVTNKSVSVEVNPTYQQAQTPASIYYDVLSALHAGRV
jgi:hypothetical protein